MSDGEKATLKTEGTSTRKLLVALLVAVAVGDTEIKKEYAVEFTGASVPEPSSFLLFSLGAIGFSVRRRMKWRNLELKFKDKSDTAAVPG